MGIYTSQNIQNFGSDSANRQRVSNFKTVFNSNNDGIFDGIHLWDGALWDDASNEPNNPVVLQRSINPRITGLNGSFIGQAPNGVDLSTNLYPLGISSTYSNARAIVQSRQYFKYSVAQSSFAKISGIFAPNQNGITVPAIVARSNGTQKSLVLQDQWNIDSFSSVVGTNPSGKQIDFNNVQSLIIDSDGAAGKIRIGFIVDGIIMYAHQFYTSNQSNEPFIRSLTLPIRAELSNIAGQAISRFGIFDDMDGVFLQCASSFDSGTASCALKESSVMVEGDDKKILNPCAISRETISAITTVIPFTPLLGIRPKELFNNTRNKVTIFPTYFSLSKTGGNPIEIALIVDGQIVGGSAWGDDGNPDISYQINRPPNTATISGGTCLQNFSFSGGNKEINIPLDFDVLKSISLSQIDQHVIEQTEFIIAARVPAGNATVEACILDIGENYS